MTLLGAIALIGLGVAIGVLLSHLDGRRERRYYRRPAPGLVTDPARERDFELGHGELRALCRLTVPEPGRPGWRRDPLSGRTYYSAAWVGERE